MICRHCGTELDDMGGVLVDARSGDDGGTYDYCPDNPVGDEDERLHEVQAARYYVTQSCSCPNSPVEHEVSKADYVAAERRAGFHNTLGQPNEPATASFSSSNPPISGRIENEPLL